MRLVRAHLLALAVALEACAPTPSPRVAPAVDPPKKAPPAAERCAEPTSLAQVGNDVLASDPAAPIEWVRGSSDHLRIKRDAREYAMTPEGAITASEDGKALWTVPPLQVAGGAFGLMLSPSGGIVVRNFSRGGLELFSANDGRLLRKVGDAVPSPDDTFVLELPRIPFALDAWDHVDVRFVPLDPEKPIRSIATLPLKQGEHPKFGAASCATSTLIAVSFPTELAVYRARDLVKLAVVANPGPGAPTFTRSGRYIVLEDDEKPRATFELRR